MEVVLLVATMVFPGVPGTTRAVPADWPYFRTMAECVQAAKAMRSAPAVVEMVSCEPHQLEVNTGRIVR